ncbi:MAG TPA: DUF892 family protein [Fimbriimonadaceae bacterium]|nr:DUF892 family protein [Fimbriimonadaceae bacterium]
MNELSEAFKLLIGEMHHAELGLSEVLPRAAEAARGSGMSSALHEEVILCKGQAQRLIQVSQMAGSGLPEATGGVLPQLLMELISACSAAWSGDDVNWALIGARRRVAHYKIASYRVARSWAEILSPGSAVTLLEESLKEEESRLAIWESFAEEGVRRNPRQLAYVS